MTAVPNPIPYFTDLDGDPLDAGFIYIGIAGMDARTNPVQVFWDADLTIPAAQPIRTVNGYPLYQGRPAAFFIAQDEASITVLQSNGVAVITNAEFRDIASDFSGPDGASLIGRAGGGTVQDSIDTLNMIGFSIDTEPFNAVGDGVTDDAVPIAAFVNHAIANPGIPHYFGNKTYATTAVLPTISTPNVCLRGAGVTIHNVGSLMTGTQIKWIGALSPAASMVTLTAVSGGANQFLSNVTFDGIGLNCNSGTIGYGMKADSIWECDIDIAVANPSAIALDMNVVATLGETQSSQKSRIRLKSRHIETPGGAGLRLGGSAAANVSMNEFDVDIVHMNNTAIFCNNSDNNDWHFVRTFKAPGGTATESISLQGSMNFGENCRAERFWFISSNLPVHAYATGLTYPSSGNTIFSLDTENGTPAPVIEAGAGLNWRKDVTLMEENDWVSFTPVITSAAGTITTVTSQSGEYRKMGKLVEFRYQWIITTNGTGATAILASLPIVAGAGVGNTANGRERAIGGKQLAGTIDAGSGTLSIFNYDGTYPGVNGGTYLITGTYECA